MADSFQPDSFQPDSFTPDKPAAKAPTGKLKMPSIGGVQYDPFDPTHPESIGIASSFLMNLFNAPFELVGETGRGIVEANNPGPFRAPTILQNMIPPLRTPQPPENPFSLVNKVLRAGAGAIHGTVTGQGALETARAAYNAPRGTMGPVEDTALALMMGKVAPEVASAPMDAAIAGTGKVLKGAESVAAAIGKRAIRTALGPSTEAQTALVNRPADMARQTNFVDLGDRLAQQANDLSGKLSELDNEAWNTLPVVQTVPKEKIVSILENVRQRFVGKGGSKISSADQKAVSKIDTYIARVKNISQETPPEGSAMEGSGLTAAIKLRGKTYVGKPGEIHADIINRMASDLNEDPNTVIDAVNKIGDMGFSQGGKFLSRAEVKAQTGSRPEAASLIAAGQIARPKLTGLAASLAGQPENADISFPQLKDIIQSVQKDARYDLPEDDPVNLAVKDIRHNVDEFLKTENPAYADKMVPVAQATSALKNMVSKFRLERETSGGYLPTKVTVDRLTALPKEKSPELARTIEAVKNATGSDFADEAKLTAYKQEFDALDRARGSTRTNLGAATGAAAGSTIAGAPGAMVGGGLGAWAGRSSDVYGGPIAKAILSVVAKGKTATGNVLSSVNQAAQGTPYQDIIKNILNQRPVLLPLLQGGY